MAAFSRPHEFTKTVGSRKIHSGKWFQKYAVHWFGMDRWQIRVKKYAVLKDLDSYGCGLTRDIIIFMLHTPIQSKR